MFCKALQGEVNKTSRSVGTIELLVRAEGDKMEYVAIQRLVEIDLVVLEYSDIIVKPVEEQKTMTAFVEARTELEELTELLRRSSSWGTSTVSSSS